MRSTACSIRLRAAQARGRARIGGSRTSANDRSLDRPRFPCQSPVTDRAATGLDARLWAGKWVLGTYRRFFAFVPLARETSQRTLSTVSRARFSGATHTTLE